MSLSIKCGNRLSTIFPRAAGGPDEAQSVVQELAAVSNEELLVMPVIEKLDQTFINTECLNAPAEDSPKYQTKWPQAWLVRNGDIRADP